MSTYRVTGRFRYREHEPGETFEADLDPEVEARAVGLGSIQVIDSSPTRLRPGSYRLPPGWKQPNQDPDGAAIERPFSLKGAR